MDLRCRISSQSNFQIVFRFVQHWTANDFSVKFWHFLKLQIRQFEHFKGKLKGDLFETLLRFSPKLRQNKQKTAAATRDAKSALCLKHSCANSRGRVPLIVVHCCIPVSLLIGGWDWVQGGNPLYAAVKCLSDRRGQIWRIFFNFFAKSTCHIHFPGGIFFGGSKKKFYPLKWAIFWGHRHFPRIEGPFPKLRGRAVRGPQALCFGMFF